MSDLQQGDSTTPQNVETTTPNTPEPTGGEHVDEIVRRRVGSYAKRTNQAIAERDDAVTRAQALEAELALEREDKARMQLELKEKQLEEEYPLASEHLKKFPNLGITATSPEDYETKLAELNKHLADQGQPTQQNATQQAQVAPTTQQPQAPSPAIVAPSSTAGTLPPSQSSEILQIANLSQSEYAKLSQEDRSTLLRELDSRNVPKTSPTPN